MKKKRSEVWKFFTQRAVNQAKCSFCLKIISFKGGATGNLLRHLKLVHPTAKGGRDCLKNNLSIPEKSMDGPSTSGGLVTVVPKEFLQANEVELCPEEVSPCVFPVKSGNPDSFLILSSLSDQETQDIHNSLVTLLAKNYLPVQLVDSEHFREFVNKLNNNYQVPSCHTISNTIIPQLYNVALENVRNFLDVTKSCCLTTDGWTSCANTSFITVTAHYITEDNQLQSSLLDCFEYREGDTAEHLSSELQRVTHEWNIHNKIIAVVSNDTANMLAAVKLTGWTQVPCFAHTINSIVQSSLPNIDDLQSKINKIVEFLKRGTETSCILKDMQFQQDSPILSLKQDSMTSWNSTFDMFSGILEVKDSLVPRNNSNLPYIDNDEIAIMEGICDILNAFKSVTEEMSSEKQVTASKVILLSNALKKHCSSYLEIKADAPLEVKQLTQSLLEHLNERFHLIEDNEVYAEATILDPRFKRYGFITESAYEKTKQSLISQVTDMIITPENTETLERKLVPQNGLHNFETQTTSASIWTEFDQAVSSDFSNPRAAAIIEVTKYLEEALHPRTDNPLEWWAHRSHIYPNLHTLAIKKLCIVATSIPSERIFPKAGLDLIDLRNRLKGKCGSQLLFLNANL